MALEAIWTASELANLGRAIKDFEETVQAWEQEHDIKVTDLMVNVGTMGREARPLGLISMVNPSDTTLQFEALEASITIA